MLLQDWLFFVSIVFAAALSPGPNVLLVISNTARAGIVAGFKTIAGIILGLWLFAIVSALGLGLLLQHYPVLFTVMKILGGVYLIYIGGTMITSQLSVDKNNNDSHRLTVLQNRSNYFLQGVSVSFSNPKAILFFSAIFPAFIGEISGSIIGNIIMLSMTISVVVLFVHVPGLYHAANDVK